MPVPISVIILTFNEESNLTAALDSVCGWATEVFVVDSFSTDRTVDIALSHRGSNVTVVQHRFEGYASQWNWALENLPLSQKWILKLDADERGTEKFWNEVQSAIATADDDVAAFIVHWRLIFMGRWLRWGGLFPNGNVRLWRRGKGVFEKREVNEHLVIDGRVREIMEPIDHRDYKSLSHWLDRHNRYSSMEALALIAGNLTGETKPRLFGRQDERRMWLRRLYYRMPLRQFIYFLYRYIFRLGFLDGIAGFRFIFLHACALYWIDLKVKEHAAAHILPEVIWPSRGRPDPRLQGDGQAEVVINQ